MRSKEIDIKEMISIYDGNGKSVQAVVKHYGCRHDRVVRLLRENGIEVEIKERKK